MTDETLKKAMELHQQIGRDWETIDDIDKMLKKFFEKNCVIKVSIKTGSKTYDDTISIGNEIFPELRDALKQARERIKCEAIKKKEKLEAL